MDGVDAALVRLDEHHCKIVAARTWPYSAELRSTLLRLSRNPAKCTVDDMGHLDHWVAETFRDAALAVLAQAAVKADEITAIGSHGQTLRHQPRASRPFTTQLGDPNIIAAGTGITTVADFRRRDIADGGEGAPLTPAFHAWAFSGPNTRAVLNIGGFANLTILPGTGNGASGFDTGPGNSLMDGWNLEHRGTDYDESGAWASSGEIVESLLEKMLSDDYFARQPPKSTGFEYFDNAWLRRQLSGHPDLPAEQVQATLCELTARSAAEAIAAHAPDANEVLLCGGGVHNLQLVKRLQANLPGHLVSSTAKMGIEPDWIEAAAFAWLAARRLAGLPGNLPSVTGARKPAVLGGIFSGRS
ncbi:MAG: anhydro-N-acetylmuramic acid kinase [Halioglobus sp.]|nr:anhydro-N-acetylmuramic acid kinase [Halioglobus sp.]